MCPRPREDLRVKTRSGRAPNPIVRGIHLGERRLAPWLLLAVAAVQMGLVFGWAAPGPLSIDEVIYQRMVHNLVQGHGLSLWNGFEERPSPELAALFIRPVGDRLVAPYPYGFPAIAAPFYALFGSRGLVVVNALAFVGVLALCYRLGRDLLGSSASGLAAAGLLGLGTYAWEYSMATWPHTLALLLSLAALLAGLEAARTPRGAFRAALLAVLAGLLLGAGTTVRFDVFFLLPLLLAPFLLAPSLRWRELGGLTAGLLPGLAFVSATNLARWETWIPFTYGSPGGPTQAQAYLPLLAVAVVGFLLLRLAVHPSARAFAERRRPVLPVACAGILLGALVLPPLRELALRLAEGTYTLLVDIRNLPIDRVEPAMERTEGGAVVYYGALKKALLQSCPYLALLVVPAYGLFRKDPARLHRALLFAPMALVVGVFSFFSWHGGLALNIRYFLPVLPFAAILTVDAIRTLAARAHRLWMLPSGAAMAGAMALYFFWRPADHAVQAMEPLLLDVPLLIAGLLATLCALWLVRPGRLPATLTLATAGAALGWSTGVAFGYDASWAHHRRAAHHAFATRTAHHLEPDSLVLAEAAAPFYGLVEHRPGVRIALPWADRFADSESLIAHHQERGRPVYGVLSRESWEALAASGALDRVETRGVARIGPFHLARLLPSRAAHQGAPLR